MSREIEPYPEPDGWDRIQDLALAGVSALPGIGSPAVVLLDRLAGPSLGRRRDAWLRCIAEAIRELQRRAVDVEHLPDDDHWVTALLRASRVAAGTHLEGKLRMLKAAIVNKALPDAPADFLTMRFLALVEDLSPEHFLLLGYARNPTASIPRGETMYIKAPLVDALKPADLGISDDWLNLAIKDLQDATLLLQYSAMAAERDRWVYKPFTTDLGTQLVEFVTLYEPGEVAGPQG